MLKNVFQTRNTKSAVGESKWKLHKIMFAKGLRVGDSVAAEQQAQPIDRSTSFALPAMTSITCPQLFMFSCVRGCEELACFTFYTLHFTFLIKCQEILFSYSTAMRIAWKRRWPGQQAWLNTSNSCRPSLLLHTLERRKNRKTETIAKAGLNAS